jgi:hypothetical protein
MSLELNQKHAYKHVAFILISIQVLNIFSGCSIVELLKQDILLALNLVPDLALSLNLSALS